MIIAHCRSNHDLFYKRKFPYKFQVLPRKEDRIVDSENNTWKIVDIYHCYNKDKRNFPFEEDSIILEIQPLRR